MEDLFTIQQVPGRGMGVVASTKILKGTRIISEAPLFTVPRDTNDLDLIKAIIRKQLGELTTDQQSAFRSLFNAFEEGDLNLNIARTNALPLGSNAAQSAIFLQSARINHACNPNSQNTWNSKLGQLTIHSVRDIEKGEEITIGYLDGFLNFATRQARLLHSFKFACACELCSLPQRERGESDKRRTNIAALDKSIGDGMSIMATPLSCLGKAHEALVLMRKENVTGPDIARLYYDAFQISIAHSDQARAKVFAQRAYANRRLCEGADSPDVARLNGLVQNPADHRLFGTTQKWSSNPSDIPDVHGEQELEDWLWRKKKWLRK